ncbi:Inositol 2-dehydrogenase/D-chiro-inositol 3-dehydrogenase [Mycovorax composti]|jgi:Predicted dehydrogenases and related proteins|uniref:Inositol 2-dehydrogenase/D-chiro-inositol 3-dehydrogenase n=2 Tax=Chitinophagaceae TaxID=563835 RepID=A0ABZ2ELT9_9BACT
MKKNQSNSRRKFIKNAALIGAGITIVPRHVLGRGFVAPSDKLNIAGIGVGGKGESDLTSFAKSPNVNIVALCDVDERQAVKSRKNFPKAKFYKDFREMLEKEKNNIDACSISTPDHTHAVATLAAMQLGKHVYTQKPLTHDIYEARILTQAAKKYKVVTQMGNQGASGEGVRRAKEIYDAGLIGDIVEVHAWTNRPVWPHGLPKPTGDHPIPAELDWDLWLGPTKYEPYNPVYVPFNWRGWWSFGTGALGDMACHIMDPIYRILPIKYPDSAECSIANQWLDMWKEANYIDSCPMASIIHLNYPRTDKKGSIKVSWYDGGLLPQRPDELLPEEPFGNWDGGCLFIGTKGKLLMDCYGANPRLLPTRLMKEVNLPKPTLKRVPEGHYLQWVNACIAGYGKGETSSPFEYAGPFTESVLMGNLAIRSAMMVNPKMKGWEDKYLGRKKLLWDAENMKITNFDEANQFVKREYRDGWSLTL